jgi:hypothetical protein
MWHFIDSLYDDLKPCIVQTPIHLKFAKQCQCSCQKFGGFSSGNVILRYIISLFMWK